VRVLARAFRDNPLNRAVLGHRGPRARERSNARGMRGLVPRARRHGETLALHDSGRLAGVLLAAPPGVTRFPAPPLASQLRTLLGQGLRVARRWQEVFQTLDAERPFEEHAYLATLGVEPACQGQGVGSALLARWLARVDAEGAPAYLETDRPENLLFYTRTGFDVTREIRVLGAPVWLLWRPQAAGVTRRSAS